MGAGDRHTARGPTIRVSCVLKLLYELFGFVTLLSARVGPHEHYTHMHTPF